MQGNSGGVLEIKHRPSGIGEHEKSTIDDLAHWKSTGVPTSKPYQAFARRVASLNVSWGVVRGPWEKPDLEGCQVGAARGERRNLNAVLEGTGRETELMRFALDRECVWGRRSFGCRKGEKTDAEEATGSATSLQGCGRALKEGKGKKAKNQAEEGALPKVVRPESPLPRKILKECGLGTGGGEKRGGKEIIRGVF